jgi:hypothetical protein
MYARRRGEEWCLPTASNTVCPHNWVCDVTLLAQQDTGIDLDSGYTRIRMGDQIGSQMARKLL